MTLTFKHIEQLLKKGKIRGFVDKKPDKVVKQSKYKNTRCEFNGIKFDSIRERKRYIDLEFAQKQGVIKDLRLQVPYLLVDTEDFKMTYIADFVYFDIQSGLTIVEDAKGFKTKEYKKKKRLMKKVLGITIKET